MNYHSAAKNLRKKIGIKAGDRVLCKLGGTAFETQWEEFISMHCTALKKAKELDEMQKVMDAKNTLFWAELRMHTEQAESSEDRGKVLAIRYDDDGEMVLVEFKDTPVDRGDFLRKLFGRGDSNDREGQEDTGY